MPGLRQGEANFRRDVERHALDVQRSINDCILRLDNQGVINVKDYGAKGDGVTDDQPAFQAALDALADAGGGTLRCTPGDTYLLSAEVSHSVVIPVATSSFGPDTQSIAAHLYLENATGVHIDARGATIVSDQSGGAILLLDGAQQCGITGGVVRSTTTTNGDDSDTVISGKNAIALTSMSRDSVNCWVDGTKFENVYTAVYCFGDAGSDYRVRNLWLPNLWHVVGKYGVALHNNGVNVYFPNLRTETVGRHAFLYGCDTVTGSIIATSVLGGFHTLIKAYDAITQNIWLTLIVEGRSTTSPDLSFQSQHNVAAQPTPAKVRNVHVFFDNSSGSGGLGIEFDYYQDSTLTGSVATALFEEIVLEGRLAGSITSTVLQTTTLGTLDANRLILGTTQLPSISIYAQGGFRSLGYFHTSGVFGNGSTTNFSLGQTSPTYPSLTGNATGEFVMAGDVHRFFNKAASSERWRIDSNGHWVTPLENTYDIGRGSASRPKNVYITGSVYPGAGTALWTSGSGTPEGSITAPVGSLYTDTSGGASTTLYVKESGGGNTGWVAK